MQDFFKLKILGRDGTIPGTPSAHVCEQFEVASDSEKVKT